MTQETFPDVPIQLFTKVYDSMLDDNGISDAARTLAMKIKRWSWRNGEKIQIQASLRELSDLFGTRKDRLYRLLMELEKAGYISVERSGKVKTSPVYNLQSKLIMSQGNDFGIMSTTGKASLPPEVDKALNLVSIRRDFILSAVSRYNIPPESILKIVRDTAKKQRWFEADIRRLDRNKYPTISDALKAYFVSCCQNLSKPACDSDNRPFEKPFAKSPSGKPLPQQNPHVNPVLLAIVENLNAGLTVYEPEFPDPTIIDELMRDGHLSLAGSGYSSGTDRCFFIDADMKLRCVPREYAERKHLGPCAKDNQRQRVGAIQTVGEIVNGQTPTAIAS